MISIYEIYDADPAQNGDCAWHETIRAHSVSGAQRQAKRRVRGYDEYPAGTVLWYISRELDGSQLGEGTFSI
jgi:hypothetical protein